MLYNTYRPGTFDDVIGQDNVVNAIKHQSMNDNFAHGYLLQGQYGSGKTTVAKLLAKSVNCENKDEQGNPCCECTSCKAIQNGVAMDVTEIDGASNNGVEMIRNVIETVSYLPATMKKKVYIIDEAHMLSSGAFNALLKTLEEPPEHVIFILCTTEKHKIPYTIRSRTMPFDFLRIDEEKIIIRLKEIAEKESINITDDALALISKYAYGAMRDALRILEKCAAYKDITIDADVVRKQLGVQKSDTYFSLIEALLNRDKQAVLGSVDSIYTEGTDLCLVLNDLIEIIADILIVKTCGSLLNTESYIANASHIAENSPIESIFALSECITQLQEHSRNGFTKQSFLIKLIQFTCTTVTIDALQERIIKLEERLANYEAIPVSTVSNQGMEQKVVTNKAAEPTAGKEDSNSSKTAAKAPDTDTNKDSELEKSNHPEEAPAEVSEKVLVPSATKEKDETNTSKPTPETSETDSKTQLSKERAYSKEKSAEKSSDTNKAGTKEKKGKNELKKDTFIQDMNSLFSSFNDFNNLFTHEESEEENEADATNASDTESSEQLESNNEACDETPSVKNYSDEVANELAVLDEDVMSSEAVKHCEKEYREGILYLFTELKPIKKIVETYCKVKELTHIKFK